MAPWIAGGLLLAACGDGGPPDAVPGLAPAGMVWIPAGPFWMGSQDGDPDAPVHQVTVRAFWLDVQEVTNAEFARFVAATNHVTEAERVPTEEQLPDVPAERRVPGALVFRAPTGGRIDLADFQRWWEYVPGANWRHPEGPGSAVGDRADHPVVQVSWNDAQAYAAWAHKRLPTEAEWERAARGGLDRARFCWGHEQMPGGRWQANIWQGRFPTRNDLTDGFAGTARVRSFPPNGYGLYDMSGNVWEWCQDRYRPDAYGKGALRVDPRGPDDAAERVMRGGSFLCSDVYCLGYLPGMRMKSSPDTGLCHAGFRCAKDPEPR